MHQVRKFFPFLVCFLFILLFTGCHGYTAPEEVVGTAYTALQDDDLKTFISTLRDEALNTYGNEDGMCYFQKIFLGKDTRLERATGIDTAYDFCGRESKKVYKVSISGKSSDTPTSPFSTLLRLTVICELTYKGNEPSRVNKKRDCENQTRKSALCQISAFDFVGFIKFD